MLSLFPFLAYGYHEGYYHYNDPIHCFVTFLRYKYTTNFVSVNKLLSGFNKTIQNSHLHLTVIQLKTIDFGLVRVLKVISPFLKCFRNRNMTDLYSENSPVSVLCNIINTTWFLLIAARTSSKKSSFVFITLYFPIVNIDVICPK